MPLVDIDDPLAGNLNHGVLSPYSAESIFNQERRRARQMIQLPNDILIGRSAAHGYVGLQRLHDPETDRTLIVSFATEDPALAARFVGVMRAVTRTADAPDLPMQNRRAALPTRPDPVMHGIVAKLLHDALSSQGNAATEPPSWICMSTISRIGRSKTASTPFPFPWQAPIPPMSGPCPRR